MMKRAATPATMSFVASILVLLAISSDTLKCEAFASIRSAVSHTARTIQLYSTAETESSTQQQKQQQQQQLLSLSLEKPLGMILEEVEEGAPKGVFVLELAEGGSAAACPEANKIVGCKLVTVMGEDVTTIGFDDVMDKIINSPSPVNLELQLPAAQEAETGDVGSSIPEFDVGTPVTVTVQREGQPDLAIEAKVGDNLRTALLENQVEVYRGFKAKIGNCGGGGQCGFCAVEFVDSEGWEPRSEYEDKKIKNSPNSRLSCLNNIQGPVTIKM